MHAEALAWCQRWGSTVYGHALDVGGRNVNGTARDLWPNMEWTVLDIAGDPGNTTDRVITADATEWTPDRKYHLVLSTEMFEHEPQWRLAVEMMKTALDSNGLIVITCASPARLPHSGFDGGPLRDGEKYQGIDPLSLNDALNGLFGVIDVNYRSADVYAAAWYSHMSWDRIS